MTPVLSILTPAVPSRITQLDGLAKKLGSQIGDLPVEHLIFLDNKRRTVGEKRDSLLRIAKGSFVAYVDDDDDVSNDYVDQILGAINYNSNPTPDVITFEQKATVDGISNIIQFGLGNPNEPFITNAEEGKMCPVIRRNAWHVCAWKRELAIKSSFPPINYGEDWAYASQLCKHTYAREVHIPKILHFYRHSSTTTEAPPGS